MRKIREFIANYYSIIAIILMILTATWGVVVYKIKPASESHIVRLGNLGAYLSGLGILFLVVQVVRDMDTGARRVKNEELERNKSLCLEVDQLLDKYRDYAGTNSEYIHMKKMKFYSLMNSLGTMQTLVDQGYYDIHQVAEISLGALTAVFNQIETDAVNFEPDWNNDETRLELKRFIDSLKEISEIN